MSLVVALTPVVEALERLGVAYRISGSVASSAHGVPRATNDVDLVADLGGEHVSALCRELGADYYADEAMIREAVRRRSSFNLLHLPTAYKVDVFLRREDPFEDEVFARRADRPLAEDAGARTFAFTTAEDIVLRKLCWFRDGGEVSERQWHDVLGVLRLQRGGLDEDHLERWADRLDVRDLLARARREAAR